MDSPPAASGKRRKKSSESQFVLFVVFMRPASCPVTAMYEHRRRDMQRFTTWLILMEIFGEGGMEEK